MNRRFSSQELFDLRNNIPINFLIEKKLMIPSRFDKKYFRFICPICCEHDTATNPKTNLARCFRCERNFNTIDLVMICKKMDFVKSVKYLKAYQQKISSRKNHDSLMQLSKILKNATVFGKKISC